MHPVKYARAAAALGSVIGALFLCVPRASAEDTDLFVGATAAAQNPNVLVIIDNSANWSSAAQHWLGGVKQGQSELAALRTVVDELSDKINLGVMLFTEGANANNPGGPGGYVRFHIRQMTAGATGNKATLQELIGADSGCTDGANSLNSTPNCIYKNFGTPAEKTGTAKTDYSAAMFEAFKYFGGYTSPAHAQDDVAGTPVSNGKFGPLRYSGAPDFKSDGDAYTTDASKSGYVSPISNSNACAKNYIIFIGNGFPVQDSPSTLLSGVAGDTSQLQVPLFTTTSTTSITNVGSGCGTPVASNCEGKITQAFKDAHPADTYTCINPVNTSCAGVDATDTTGSRRWTVQATKTVVTVTPTGSFGAPSTVRYADEWAKFVYTTDVNATPGQQNIATYTIDVFKDQQDANQTGLLLSMAKYGGGEYFQATSQSEIEAALRDILVSIQSVNSTFASASLPISATNRSQNENRVYMGMFRPDAKANPRWYGNLKAYQIGLFNGTAGLADADGKSAVEPSTGFLKPCARSFWSADSSDYWKFSPESAGHCTTAATGIWSDQPDGPQVEKGATAYMLRKDNNPGSRNMLTCSAINNCSALVAAYSPIAGAVDSATAFHTLGWDMNDENDNTDIDEARPSMHGDVIHSRALPVNYGTLDDSVVYYGSNDGAFHAIHSKDGTELWSFIAPEHWSKLKRLRDGEPIVLYPNMTAPYPVPTPTKKDYFFDGSTGLFQSADDSQIWIYPSMRRGGRTIYAFDVSAKDDPKFMWNAGCPNSGDDVGCSTGFSQIGETWSLPSPAMAKGHSTTTPVVVMGGGYDGCDDADNSTPNCAGTKGNRIYVFDGKDGTLLRAFNTERAVPADVTLVDRNGDGYIDHAYAADTGGAIYRVDFSDPATLASLSSSEWAIHKIAYTSGGGRKFLYGPGALPTKGRIYLTITSGDREHPLISNYPYAGPVVNRAYMVIDNFDNQPVDLDSNAMNDFTTDMGCSQYMAANSRGWFFDLADGTGEQGVTSTVIFGGVVYFSTNYPVAAVNSCSNNLGRARAYGVNLLNGSGAVGIDSLCGGKRSGNFVGGGLPPSPVVATVTIDGKQISVVIGGVDIGAGGTGEACVGCTPKPKLPIVQKRTRQFWYQKGDK